MPNTTHAPFAHQGPGRCSDSRSNNSPDVLSHIVGNFLRLLESCTRSKIETDLPGQHQLVSCQLLGRYPWRSLVIFLCNEGEVCAVGHRNPSLLRFEVTAKRARAEADPELSGLRWPSNLRADSE